MVPLISEKGKRRYHCNAHPKHQSFFRGVEGAEGAEGAGGSVGLSGEPVKSTEHRAQGTAGRWRGGGTWGKGNTGRTSALYLVPKTHPVVAMYFAPTGGLSSSFEGCPFPPSNFLILPPAAWPGRWLTGRVLL